MCQLCFECTTDLWKNISNVIEACSGLKNFLKTCVYLSMLLLLPVLSLEAVGKHNLWKTNYFKLTFAFKKI